MSDHDSSEIRLLPPPGLLAGRWRLLDPLGHGGMATVWRAWDEQRDLFRAVKLLDRRVAKNERLRRRLLDEAHILARLQHPHVVTLCEAGSDGEQIYLVMELMLGGSLQERLLESPLPPRMAAGVLDGVLEALQLAHDNGVVHRDVKPHNVLLDAAGVPKVTDFGIARSDEGAGLTRTGVVLGTLAYMPPEQKLSARTVDARSDLYAAGATLYALVTGREPHDLYAAGLDERIRRDLYEQVPEPLAEVIRTATSFRPEDRFPSAAAMALAIRTAAGRLAHDPPTAPLVSATRRQRAKALTAAGPTLQAETQETERVRVVTMSRHPTTSPAPSTPPARWAVGVGVGATLLLSAAAFAIAGSQWTGRTEQSREAVSEPPSAAAPSDAIGPLLDTAAERVVTVDGSEDEELAAPRPSPRAPAVVPEGEAAQLGAWRVQSWPGAKRHRTDVVATLAAAPVEGGGTPELIVQCRSGDEDLVLRTGEAFGEDDVFVTIVADGERERTKVIPHGTIEGDLVVTKAAPRIEALLGADDVVVEYPAPGGRLVRAQFAPGDTSGVRQALAGGCR